MADSDTPEAAETAGLLTWNIGSNTAGTPGTVTDTGPTPAADSTYTTGTAASASSITFSHTAGPGANRLMMVGVSWWALGPRRPFHRLLSEDRLTSAGTTPTARPTRAIYYLLAPAASTTANVVVTFSGLVNAVAGAVTFAGVNQTTPLGTFVGATGTNSAPSVSPTTVADDLVLDTVAAGATLTVGVGQTSRWNVLQGVTGAASTRAGHHDFDHDELDGGRQRHLGYRRSAGSTRSHRPRPCHFQREDE